MIIPFYRLIRKSIYLNMFPFPPTGNRCIKKMDHHCPWINHCVGWANHAYFTYFLLFSIIGSLHGTVILCCSFYRGIHRYWYLSRGLVHLATVQFTMYSIIMCIFAMGLAIGVVIALGMLLYFQVSICSMCPALPLHVLIVIIVILDEINCQESNWH